MTTKSVSMTINVISTKGPKVSKPDDAGKVWTKLDIEAIVDGKTTWLECWKPGLFSYFQNGATLEVTANEKPYQDGIVRQIQFVTTPVQTGRGAPANTLAPKPQTFTSTDRDRAINRNVAFQELGLMMRCPTIQPPADLMDRYWEIMTEWLG